LVREQRYLNPLGFTTAHSAGAMRQKKSYEKSRSNSLRCRQLIKTLIKSFFGDFE
jgi:hypothetical protein